jgi:hypothetical protein
MRRGDSATLGRLHETHTSLAGDYYYFTQPVAKLAPTCLATHARDWTALIPDTPATRSPRGIRPYLSAWVGVCPGPRFLCCAATVRHTLLHA